MKVFGMRVLFGGVSFYVNFKYSLGISVFSNSDVKIRVFD